LLAVERDIGSGLLIQSKVAEQVGTILSSWMWRLVWWIFTDVSEKVLRAYSGKYTLLQWRCGNPKILMV